MFMRIINIKFSHLQNSNQMSVDSNSVNTIHEYKKTWGSWATMLTWETVSLSNLRLYHFIGCKKAKNMNIYIFRNGWSLFLKKKINQSPLPLRILLVKIGLLVPKKILACQCFSCCYIASHWKRVCPFIWTNLNLPHQRMLCALFGWYLPQGSGEKCF